MVFMERFWMSLMVKKAAYRRFGMVFREEMNLSSC